MLSGWLHGLNEDPLEAARREFFEETGYGAEEFVLMGSAFPYPGLSDQRIYYALARGAYKISDPQPDVNEILRTI